MQKIAILGGTFNPIHNGHIHLAKQFAERINADKVLLIPTFKPPHKTVKDFASNNDRLQMCRLAAKETNFEVSDIEFRRKGISYTSDTLKELKKEYPNSEFYFISGEDMFLTLKKWHEPNTIFKLAVVCAAPRSNDGMQPLLNYAGELEKIGAKSLIEDIKYLPISSTMVRNAVKNGKDIEKLVPMKVADYIAKNNLYLERKNGY